MHDVVQGWKRCRAAYRLNRRRIDSCVVRVAKERVVQWRKVSSISLLVVAWWHHLGHVVCCTIADDRVSRTKEKLQRFLVRPFREKSLP